MTTIKLFVSRLKIALLLFITLLNFQVVYSQHSVAQDWNEMLLEAIRNDFARPTVHARNLYHHSIITYDAWAAFDPSKDTYFLGKTINGYDCDFEGVNIPLEIQSARHETISHASFHFIKSRYQFSPDFDDTFILIYNYMVDHGYNTNNDNTDYQNGGPAELGNYLAQQILNYGGIDGSNEPSYSSLFYNPINPPLVMTESGNPDIVDPNRWQALTLDSTIDQSGNTVENTTPFVTPEWGKVDPFALTSEMSNIHFSNGGYFTVYFDTLIPAFIDNADPDSWESFYKWNHALVSIWQSHLDPNDGVEWDISPGAIGSNSWYPSDSSDYEDFYNLINGGDPSNGYPVNPITGQPYTPQIVPRADYARVLAEFWADGIDSETPPGHWFEIYHYVSNQASFDRKWKGVGPTLDRLEYDVKSHLTLGGAMHDAAISAWSLKGYYDYIRPVSSIRYMCDMGQSTDSLLPSYNPYGIPLLTGYIELVDSLDTLAGTNYEHVGKVKLYTWRGHEYIEDPESDLSGVGWILGENWWPYQRPTFVTPPFSGFVSGHSTFSRAAAGILEQITGSPYFPNGLGEFVAIQNEFLQFEEGPSTTITLQWASYRDAADQCSLSRIWGGIHPPIDDIPGRMIGDVVGEICFLKADSIFSNELQSMISANISDTVINIYDIGSSIDLDIELNTPMNISITPQVAISPIELNQVIGTNQIYWVDSFHLVIEMNVNNEVIEQLSSMIRVEGLETGTGINLAEINLENFLIVDTKKPQILSLFDTSIVLSDEHTLNGYQGLTHIDEPCDTNLVPSFQFLNSGSSLNLNSNNSVWNTSQEFIASFDFVDLNEEIDSISVTVNNIKDLFGNPLANPTHNNVCSIDTKNPGIDNVFLSDTLINIADVSNNLQIQTIVSFDEVMDTSTAPNLKVYNGNTEHTSVLMNPFASAWLDQHTFLTELWVTNDEHDRINLNVFCFEAFDVNGNAIIDTLIASNLYSDLRGPEVETIVSISEIISDNSVGSNNYYIDIDFNEPMDTTLLPLLIHESSQSTSQSLQYNIVESFPLNDMSYRVFFNVYDENVEIDNINLKILHGKDLSGNTQDLLTITDFIELDTKNPSISSFNINPNVLSLDNQIGIQLTFDEEMDTTTLVEVGFNPAIVSPVVINQSYYTWMNTTNLQINYELLFSVAENTEFYQLNVLDGLDLAGNSLVQVDIDSAFSINGLGEVENLVKEMRIFPNIISAGQHIYIDENFYLTHSKVKWFNSNGVRMKDIEFEKSGTFWRSNPILEKPGVYYISINNESLKLIVI